MRYSRKLLGTEPEPKGTERSRDKRWLACPSHARCRDSVGTQWGGMAENDLTEVRGAERE